MTDGVTVKVDDPVRYFLPPVRRGPESTIRMADYQSWGPKDLDLAPALRNNRGVKPDGSPVRVCLLDTGKGVHKDLPAPVDYFNPTRYGDNDRQGHQTHTKGTIFEYAPGIAFYEAKGLGDDGGGTDIDLAKCIDWATANECDIISASWGGGYSKLIHDAFKRFTAVRSNGRRGIAIVAAGNSGSRGVDSPGILFETIATAAYDRNRRAAGFSSIGPEVDWALPGVGIYSTIPGDRYASWDGTSMATPAGAGVMSLYVGTHWDDEWAFDVRYIRKFIEKNATDIENPGRDNKTGFGIPKPGQFAPDTTYWMF